MTNRPFSALLFSLAQYQTNGKDLLSPCSGTQASAQAGMYLPRYFLFSYCYRLCCLRGKKPWLRSLWPRLGESESVFLYTDLKFSLLSGSQHVFMWRNRALLRSRRGTLFRRTAQRARTQEELHCMANRKTGHAHGTTALTLPGSPAFLERAEELKLMLAQHQEMLFHWSSHRVFRTAQDPTWHLFYTETFFCRL